MAITLNAPDEPQPDGSDPLTPTERRGLLTDVMTLMAQLHRGTVRLVDYEVVRRFDTLVELKFPRPGNLGGWHYRLYAGVPRYPLEDRLIWAMATRKVDDRYSDDWQEEQTADIDTAHGRFKAWLMEQKTSGL
jgi:hypothetical protein